MQAGRGKNHDDVQNICVKKYVIVQIFLSSLRVIERQCFLPKSFNSPAKLVWLGSNKLLIQQKVYGSPCNKHLRIYTPSCRVTKVI